jgi:hypothetical protein
MDFTSSSDDQIMAAYQAMHPDLDESTGIVTPSDGSPPHIDQAFVSMRLGQLDQLWGWQVEIRNELQQAIAMIPKLLAKLKTAIAKRQAKIEAVKKKIRENLKRITELQKDESHTDPNIVKLKQEINDANSGNGVTDINRRLALARAITVPAGKAGDKARAAKDHLIGALESQLYAAEHGQRVKVGDLRNQLLGVEAADANHKTALKNEVIGLEAENQQLGGSKTTIGTGGQLKTLNSQLQGLKTRQTNVTDDSSAIVGQYGVGGLLDQANLAVQPGSSLALQIGALDPTALAAALANAQGSGTSAAAGTSQLDSLLEQQLATSGQELAVSQAQYGVLSEALGDLPPFGGSFATGGVVPGTLGEARTIIAHGGERVTPPGADDSPADTRPVVHQVIVEDGAVDPRKIRVIAADEVRSQTRHASRLAGRRLPSQGGGGLLGR